MEYSISINLGKDEATVEGTKKNLKKFFDEYLEFEEEDYEMIG